MFVRNSRFFFKINIRVLDSASNNINKRIHAYFNCPKKLQPSHKRKTSYIAKRSLVFINDRQDNFPIFGRIKNQLDYH